MEKLPEEKSTERTSDTKMHAVRDIKNRSRKRVWTEKTNQKSSGLCVFATTVG